MGEVPETARDYVSRGRGPSRPAVVLAVLIRLLALLLVMEISGTVHAALDLSASLGLTTHPDDDCDDEQGHECPPGCTNCHCTHGAVTWSTSPPSVRLTVVHPPRREAGFVPRKEVPLLCVDLAPLYRPPKARVHS